MQSIGEIRHAIFHFHLQGLGVLDSPTRQGLPPRPPERQSGAGLGVKSPRACHCEVSNLMPDSLFDNLRTTRQRKGAQAHKFPYTQYIEYLCTQNTHMGGEGTFATVGGICGKVLWHITYTSNMLVSARTEMKSVMRKTETQQIRNKLLRTPPHSRLKRERLRIKLPTQKLTF